MATTKDSQRERIEALKKQRDEAIKELDAILLDQASGGTRPEPRGGGGPGPGDTGP
jgi:hypothetical protein